MMSYGTSSVKLTQMGGIQTQQQQWKQVSVVKKHQE